MKTAHPLSTVPSPAWVWRISCSDYMSDFQQTNATPDDLRQWVMSFYAQDSLRIAKTSRSTTGSGGSRLPDPDKFGRGTSFSLPAFLAGEHSTKDPTARPACSSGRPRHSARQLERQLHQFRAAHRPGMGSQGRRQTNPAHGREIGVAAVPVGGRNSGVSRDEQAGRSGRVLGAVLPGQEHGTERRAAAVFVGIGKRRLPAGARS